MISHLQKLSASGMKRDQYIHFLDIFTEETDAEFSVQ
jgi:hypothetical protein